jgi:hypothetical protein
MPIFFLAGTRKIGENFFSCYFFHVISYRNVWVKCSFLIFLHYSVLIKKSKKFIKSKKKSHIRENIALLGFYCDFDLPPTRLEFF